MSKERNYTPPKAKIVRLSAECELLAGSEPNKASANSGGSLGDAYNSNDVSYTQRQDSPFSSDW